MTYQGSPGSWSTGQEELTDEERQIVRDATSRMLRALEHDTI